MNTDPTEPKPQIHIRVWRTTDEDITRSITSGESTLKWSWKVSYQDDVVAADTLTGSHISERIAKWEASKALGKLRKKHGIGRRAPLDVFYEVPEVPVSNKEMERAARRLKQIEKDLHG